MAEFKLTAPHFIEPERYKAGEVIEFDDAATIANLTPMMEPLDPAAQKLMDEYVKKNPKATISPVDDLPRSFARVVGVQEAAPSAAKVRTIT